MSEKIKKVVEAVKKASKPKADKPKVPKHHDESAIDYEEQARLAREKAEQ